MEIIVILFSVCMFLGALAVLVFAIRKVAEVTTKAMEVLAAKSLREIAEVEHLRDVNRVNYEALVNANWSTRGQAKDQESSVLSDSPLAKNKRYVTDVEGTIHNVDDLEIL